jgi:hypothetical protein
MAVVRPNPDFLVMMYTSTRCSSLTVTTSKSKEEDKGRASPPEVANIAVLLPPVYTANEYVFN